MSMLHFRSIQQMIDELERFGFKDITNDVKGDYNPYLSICTLQRPASEQEEGPINIAMVDQLLMLLEQVNPLRLKMRVWFCERCQIVGCVNYHKNASLTEMAELTGRDHRALSTHCLSEERDLRIVQPDIMLSRASLYAETTIPEWAKAPLAILLFGQ